MGAFCVPEVSKKSKWYLPKYRFLELKYHCLQYPDWKAEVISLSAISQRIQNEIKGQVEFSDKTSDLAIKLIELNEKIERVEKTVLESEKSISSWLIKGVTEGLSFVALKTRYEIPCERDMYYDRYRKFYWLLDKRL